MQILSFSPTQGSVGQSVTLSMSALPATASTSNVSVMLSGDPSVSVTSVDVGNNTIDVTIEENAQSGDFVVLCEKQDAQSATAFTVTGGHEAEPRIISLLPRQIHAGQPLTLKGTNLKEISRVEIGTRLVPSLIEHTSTLIRFTVPSTIPAGTYRVYGMSSEYGRVNCPMMLTIL